VLPAAFQPVQPTLPAAFQTAHPYQVTAAQSYYGAQLPSSLPSYSSPQVNASQLPSRLSALHAVSLNQSSAYQAALLRDYSSINTLNPRLQGETQLFLPVNFISHIRGSGLHHDDDEELLKTENGSKLYFANESRKVHPDKLNQGLFLGANAQILAVMIPNLTPEIAAYLDYMRKLGDLLVNYTSKSVYTLDHCHRYEVVENSQPWNFVDPTLQLNILKKKDGPLHNKDTAAKSSSNMSHSKSSDSKTKTPICWQWNQPDGCKFPNCRYLHKCNIEGCGGTHPAWKHVFQKQNQPTQQTRA
jgi:hypothetical protein